MSYIDKLLQGKEVEWKTLWEVTTWDKKFNAVDNYKQPKTLKYHYLLSNEIKPLILEKGNVKLLTTNETNLWTSEELAGSKISDAEVIAIPWGGNVVVQYYKGKFLTSDNRIAVSNDINYLDTKYLYHFLKNNITLLSSFYRGSGIKHPSMANVLDVQIPIPPLEIQQKIVAILDTFTELTAELTARKKQYEYYREKLLVVSGELLEDSNKSQLKTNEVQWKTLGEVIDMQAGQHISANNIMNILNEEYKFPCFGGNGIRGYVNRKSHNGSHLLIGRQGALCGNVQWYDGEFYATEHAVVVTTNDEINIRFAFHLLTLMNLNQYASKSAQPGLAVGNLKKLRIPIPPLSEQERIVTILDKFDILTNSISEGLPKEIELRKKQYEYYRSKLLSF